MASCGPTSREPTRREPSTSGRSGAPAQQKNSSKLSIQLNPLCSQLSPQPILNNDWSQQNGSRGPGKPASAVGDHSQAHCEKAPKIATTVGTPSDISDGQKTLLHTPVTGARRGTPAISRPKTKPHAEV
jgi:hypothetical protein